MLDGFLKLQYSSGSQSGTKFTNISHAHYGKNPLEILLDLIFILLIQSCYNFAHVTTMGLKLHFHGMCKIVSWSGQKFSCKNNKYFENDLDYELLHFVRWISGDLSNISWG